MIDKLEKVETFVNNILEKVFGWLKVFFISLIPQKIKDRFNITVTSSKEKLHDQKDKVTDQTKLVISKVSDKKQAAQAQITKAKEYPLKETITLQIAKVKQFVLTTPFSFYGKFLSQKYKALSALFSDKMGNLSPKQIVLAVLFLSLTSVGGVAIYSSSKDIYQQEFPNRVPASVQEFDYRPEYRNYKKKTMKVFNIRVPLFVESVREVKSLTIDFSVRTSTRFASKFLTAYDYKIKDYFFTRVEPFASAFPLEEEGKDILRDKIKRELNIFLKEENVEGTVEEVKIIFMIAS